MSKLDLSLYLVTDSTLNLKYPIENVVEQAVQGGVSVVQMREKHASSKVFFEEALKLKKILKKYKVPLIINDRLDIALAVEADGLHIGQSDLPYQVARKLLGKKKIIGLSVENLSQAASSNLLDVDYIGISPIFSTPTKTDTEEPFGIEGIRKVKEICTHRTVAIGGINKHNAKDILLAGAEGIAVVSTIMCSQDPKTAAKELKNIIYQVS